MSFYQEEKRMEYQVQRYGSPSAGRFGSYHDQSYGGGFSSAGAYGCDSSGQAQHYKMQTQCTPPRKNFFSDNESDTYQSSSQQIAQYSSGGGGTGYATANGGGSYAASHGAGGFAAGHGGAGFGGGHGSGGLGGGDPFCALMPSSFPPGTDPKIIQCFNRIDRDGSGFISDVELQTALSSFDHRFCMRTVHLLMCMFTGSNAKTVGPKEFVPLLKSLQSWKAVFQRFDRDRNGRMDGMELKDALRGLGFTIPPFAAQLLVSKFSKPGSKCFVEYDYFIECCLVVKGLTEKFKCKEDSYSGTATFMYDEFLLSVLPFIVA